MWLAAMGLMDGKVVRKHSWGVGCCARHWGALQPALPGRDPNSAATPLTIVCSHEGALWSGGRDCSRRFCMLQHG